MVISPCGLSVEDTEKDDLRGRSFGFFCLGGFSFFPAAPDICFRSLIFPTTDLCGIQVSSPLTSSVGAVFFSFPLIVEPD